MGKSYSNSQYCGFCGTWKKGIGRLRCPDCNYRLRHKPRVKLTKVLA